MKRFFIVIALLIMGCSDDSSDNGCTPGEVRICPCGGEEPDGTQTCNEDGSAWGECDCGTTDGDTDSDTDSDSDSDSDADAGTDGGYIDTDCSDVDQICDTPPADHCSADQSTLISYNGDATCIDGVCNYSTNTEICDYKCVPKAAHEGEFYCMPEECEGIVCDKTEDNIPESYFDWCDPSGPLAIMDDYGYCKADDSGPYCLYGFVEWEDCPNNCVVVEDGDDYCI